MFQITAKQVKPCDGELWNWGQTPGIQTLGEPQRAEHHVTRLLRLAIKKVLGSYGKIWEIEQDVRKALGPLWTVQRLRICNTCICVLKSGGALQEDVGDAVPFQQHQQRKAIRSLYKGPMALSCPFHGDVFHLFAEDMGKPQLWNSSALAGLRRGGWYNWPK